MFTTTSLTLPCFIKVPVQCHNSERPCIWVLGVSILRLCLRLFDKILKLFWQCGIFLFSYFNSVPLQATHESWSVSHREGYHYVSHYHHIEEDIDHIDIIWYLSHTPLTSDTTTVYLSVKSRLTNENAIMLNLLTFQSKRQDRRYQRRDQSRKSDRQYNGQEKSEVINQTDNTMAKRNQKPYIRQTIQWPTKSRSRKSDRQCNGQEKSEAVNQTDNTMAKRNQKP